MTIFFDSWATLLNILITGLVIYPSLIVSLRIAGKRSLSKLNAFDFVVTVAIGSIFASVFVWEAVAIVDGIVAMILLLLSQMTVSWLSVRYTAFERAIKSEPMAVFFEGDFFEDAMKQVRITKEEIYAEARQQNYTCFSDVYAVIVESNGVVSVLPYHDSIHSSTLKYIKNLPATEKE